MAILLPHLPVALAQLALRLPPPDSPCIDGISRQLVNCLSDRSWAPRLHTLEITSSMVVEDEHHEAAAHMRVQVADAVRNCRRTVKLRGNLMQGEIRPLPGLR